MPTRRRLAQGLGTLAGIAGLSSGRALGALTAATPRQIEGPFYPVREQPDTDLDLTHVTGRIARATGEAILVRGRVTSASGEPLAAALVDIWQANHHGRYAHPGDPNPAPLDPNFQGWGMMATDAAGGYGFRTVKPGPYSLVYLGETGWRCRHIHFKVSHADHAPLTTQMYFPGDPLLEQDLEIAKVPADRRALLIALASTDSASGLPLFRFDVVLAPL